ncbi:MAG TPA: FAD/NAD(P)-binding oxidoreductase [Hydrogenophaga sp.]|uniref:NAD(P)/FAD-dependent oxidoreductase n=1 Tax=Hydrogenophaga sp. TaxID=1904254 RepID=UPI002C5F118B|nr:FAD/NAD(P)-binding oxidoreductase [Hydrogenophaga sp.]HMN92249.1 FAD/NAD(P)-binding oxidoreductase [Hydrogenophaga sp.]HMP09284.1 FAD/NAD(P)-binding oxidoreductase [Hydrogenophaga sp.]
MKSVPRPSTPADTPTDVVRRRLLGGLGALPVAAAVGTGLASPRAQAKARLKTQARIVIAGGGAAGLTAASHLAKTLDGATITVVEGRKEHWYQPGFTLVAAGIKPQDYVVSQTREYMPRGVEWVSEAVAEIDPEGNKVVTSGGRTLPYDYLIVATGLELDYGAIEGMDTARIGQNGMGSIYHSPQGAAATWQAMSAFVDKGGTGLFGRPLGEMKCAGAPLKYTFITDDRLRRAGNRSKAELIYMAQSKSLFGVPIVAEKVRMLYQDRGIKVNHEHVLQSIDLDRRIATYRTPTGTAEQGYDFINVVPPMRAPEVVRNSPLPWTEGPLAADGWMEVDRDTLRHKRFPNVFGLGDIAGVPKGKTAASVKWQVPVAVDHLVAEIGGKTSDEVYNGYTSCPLITRLGQAMLIEFDYKDNLIQSFPGVIAPLEELWISWVMKTMALKPTYLSMLRGRA